MSNIFMSPDLGTNSSGNIICQQELRALQEFSNKGEDVIEIGNNEINPALHNLPDSPFFQDYLALNRLFELDLWNVKIAHFYGAPFRSTINYLKSNRVITTNMVDAHDRHESIKEFGNLGIPYPYSHISNDLLWNMYFYKGDADTIIVPSKMSKNFLLREGCKQKIEVIPHGVDIPESKDIQLIGELSKGMLKTEFTVGYIGGYGPDKGVRYLIEAWSHLNYKDSELLLGGTFANKGLEPFIKKYATHTTSRFNLLGWIENIHTFYNLCSIYVQPSVTEGWGMEVVEAMAHGRPVICSEGCGAADCIENGETGFVVPSRDPKAIADKIDWFKNHSQELYIMSGRCKQVAKNYSWDKIREKYINLWKDLL